MTELERQEKEANIAKLRAETESLKMNVVLNIIKNKWGQIHIKASKEAGKPTEAEH